jgi:hypothetical protein
VMCRASVSCCNRPNGRFSQKEIGNIQNGTSQNMCY